MNIQYILIFAILFIFLKQELTTIESFETSLGVDNDIFVYSDMNKHIKKENKIKKVSPYGLFPTMMKADSNKYYKTGLKDYDYIYISYYDKKWHIVDESINDTIEYSDISELSSIIDIDMKHNFIYNTYLKTISNYKADDLVNIANELSISLTKVGGKKKNKKELYDEINLIKL